MAGPNDFTGQNIQDTYQRVLQISSSGQITDGTGSLVLINATTSSHALFAVSASHEITFEVSSSYAQTASMASSDFVVQGDITANSYSGKIVASDTNENTAHFPLIATSGNTVPNISNGIQFNPSTDELQVGDVFGGTGVTISSGNVRATQNISASGNLIGNIDGGSF